eukprot:TRINITY_DN7497_c0_g2_i1.p1 TRINITY_DN7497_c0_g2~~TRINITY_DN7497_c0_g2_i1.p1  ORF type:complete len:402 (-),score=51.36 TRINITY_DN7497_c0_g2_i1:138-1343(-)
MITVADLPHDVLCEIFAQLPFSLLLVCSRVCKAFRDAAADARLSRRGFVSEFSYTFPKKAEHVWESVKNSESRMAEVISFARDWKFQQIEASMTQFEDSISSCCFVGDTHVAVATDGSYIALFDRSAPSAVRKLSLPTSESNLATYCIQYNLVSNLLLVSACSHEIYMIDVDAWKATQIDTPCPSVYKSQFWKALFIDPYHAAACSEDPQAGIFDLQTNQLVAGWKTDDRTDSLDIAHCDNNIFVTERNAVQCLDYAQGSLRPSNYLNLSQWGSTVSLAATRNLCVVGTDNGAIFGVDLRDSTQVAFHQNVSADGLWVYSLMCNDHLVVGNVECASGDSAILMVRDLRKIDRELWRGDVGHACSSIFDVDWATRSLVSPALSDEQYKPCGKALRVSLMQFR